MNPGPAPRPPIDRSATDRPGLPASNHSSFFGAPNGSTSSLTTPTLQGSRTWSGAGSMTSGLTRTISTDPLQAAGAVKQGWIKYKEEGFGGLIWKTKWVVLRQNTIDFHKAEAGKISFTIVLAHVTGVQRWDAISMCIELVRAANPAAHPGIPLREQPQKTMYMKFEGDEELYEWQDGIYTRCPAISGVSNPTNFSHRIHVGFDPTTGGFLGLPAEWERLLTASAITKEDYMKNPQAVIEVLEFYSDINKRAENPDAYPQLAPTPPALANQNKQLGHPSSGTTIAPPRPGPPAERTTSYSNQQRSVTNPGRPPGPPGPAPFASQQRNFSGPAGYGPSPLQNGGLSSDDSKLNMSPEMRRLMDEAARDVKEKKAQEDREREQQGQRQRLRDEDRERERRELEEYNASIPQKKTPLAKQELGGYSGSPAPDPSRFNPTRAAPAAPGAPGSDRSRQPPQVSGSRPPQGPSMDPSSSSPAPPRAPYTQAPRDQSPSQSLRTTGPRKDHQAARQPSPAARPPVKPSGPERAQAPMGRMPVTGAQNPTPPTRLPGPVQAVKPLNVSKTAPNGQATQPKDTAVQAKDEKPAQPRQKEARMSSMSEAEVMSKLKKIVTRIDPNQSYLKQKKIGQGASGSVYIAKIKPDATAPVAKGIYRRDGGDARVAIKTMDLRNQPRKELIVNEIIVMKESAHPNIVNYLDSFLMENDNELWVVMEYMNGGALTDVIENNPNISEDQIAAICNEV